jgi:hypothetical protein
VTGKLRSIFRPDETPFGWSTLRNSPFPPRTLRGGTQALAGREGQGARGLRQTPGPQEKLKPFRPPQNTYTFHVLKTADQPAVDIEIQALTQKAAWKELNAIVERGKQQLASRARPINRALLERSARRIQETLRLKALRCGGGSSFAFALLGRLPTWSSRHCSGRNLAQRRKSELRGAIQRAFPRHSPDRSRNEIGGNALKELEFLGPVLTTQY